MAQQPSQPTLQAPMESDLHIGVIYGALMRPPLFMGVTVDFLPVALIIWSFFFFRVSPLSGIVVLPFIWLFGYIVCRLDVDGFGIFHFWVKQFMRYRNKRERGCFYVEPF